MMMQTSNSQPDDLVSDAPPPDARPGLAVVAGATGYLGKHLIRSLHRDGWKIRALARDGARLGDVRGLVDEVFEAEATRKESLAGLFEGADVAFSSIGIRHFNRRPTFEEVDYQANLNLVELAEDAGVSRFVFVSVLDGDEHRGLSPLIDARERIVDRLRASNMESVILRPTGFFNDMADYAKMAGKGRVWLIGSGSTKVNPIHGADLADAAAKAMAQDDPEPSIALGGPDVFTQRQIGELAFVGSGNEPRYQSVNPKLIKFLAMVVRPFNANASALALMFSVMGNEDVVAPAAGSHHLSDFFETLDL